MSADNLRKLREAAGLDDAPPAPVQSPAPWLSAPRPPPGIGAFDTGALAAGRGPIGRFSPSQRPITDYGDPSQDPLNALSPEEAYGARRAAERNAMADANMRAAARQGLRLGSPMMMLSQPFANTAMDPVRREGVPRIPETFMEGVRGMAGEASDAVREGVLQSIARQSPGDRPDFVGGLGKIAWDFVSPDALLTGEEEAQRTIDFERALGPMGRPERMAAAADQGNLNTAFLGLEMAGARAAPRIPRPEGFSPRPVPREAGAGAPFAPPPSLESAAQRFSRGANDRGLPRRLGAVLEDDSVMRPDPFTGQSEAALPGRLSPMSEAPSLGVRRPDPWATNRYFEPNSIFGGGAGPANWDAAHNYGNMLETVSDAEIREIAPRWGVDPDSPNARAEISRAMADDDASVAPGYREALERQRNRTPAEEIDGETMFDLDGSGNLVARPPSAEERAFTRWGMDDLEDLNEGGTNVPHDLEQRLRDAGLINALPPILAGGALGAAGSQLIPEAQASEGGDDSALPPWLAPAAVTAAGGGLAAFLAARRGLRLKEPSAPTMGREIASPIPSPEGPAGVLDLPISQQGPSVRQAMRDSASSLAYERMPGAWGMFPLPDTARGQPRIAIAEEPRLLGSLGIGDPTHFRVHEVDPSSPIRMGGHSRVRNRGTFPSLEEAAQFGLERADPTLGQIGAQYPRILPELGARGVRGVQGAPDGIPTQLDLPQLPSSGRISLVPPAPEATAPPSSGMGRGEDASAILPPALIGGSALALMGDEAEASEGGDEGSDWGIPAGIGIGLGAAGLSLAAARNRLRLKEAAPPSSAGLIRPGRPPLPERLEFLLGSAANNRRYEAGRYLDTRRRGGRTPSGEPRTGHYSGAYASTSDAWDDAAPTDSRTSSGFATGRREPPAQIPDPGSPEYLALVEEAKATPPELRTPLMRQLLRWESGQ